jgi:hypothetical protein
MSVDASLVGSNRIEANVVDADGNIVRSGRTVFVRANNELSVSMTQDKPQYAPGDPAQLTFAVQDSQGNPAVAALGVEIVDQAVFSMVDAHPGLLRSYFELDSIYANPTYEIAAPAVDYGQLLFSSNQQPGANQAQQNLTKAAFAALGDASISEIAHGSWTDLIAKEKTLLQPAYAAETTAVSTALHAMAREVSSELSAQGCSPSSYSCGALGDTFGELLMKQLTARFLASDFWGNPLALAWNGSFSIQATTRGPDETSGTDDDYVMTIDLSDVVGGSIYGGPGGGGFGAADDASVAVPGVGAGGGSSNGSSGGGSSSSGSSSSGSSGASGTLPPSNGGPRVRKDFPETLYVNPSVITGPNGQATLDVPLADNITEWRVSTMANSVDGKLGGGESGFKVFQAFFVDVNFPATLTRGDQVSFPIAIYNYSANVQNVQLTLTPDTWYTPTGATALTVTVQPGQVTGASFPVRVDQVGLHSLTVKAIGTTVSDAVARSVAVLPDGELVTDASSGVLSGGGTANHVFSFPATGVAGSQQLYVEVYPAFLSQVVNGMDSLLRQPSGCFEQTTSTTWPNVLVLSYLQKTNQLTPATQLKAESLISTGYQRLLTFEHPGGGFSWFGTQDPAPYVSVTAFGLMEFGDMAKVADVDQAMVTRTQNWLLAQQQPDGSWKGDVSEFFSFNTSTVRNTAFVVWALGSAGYSGAEVGGGLSYLRAHLGDSGNDAYTLGLVANAFAATAPTDAALGMVLAKLDMLKQVNADEISWSTGGTQTGFYQGGMDADVSATALVTNALLLQGGSTPTVEGAIKFLASKKGPDGNFGSTQATIWTLRALLLAASKGTDGGVGTLTIAVDGTPARTLMLTPDQFDVMTTVDLSGQAAPGMHDVSVAFVGTGKVSFNAVGKYNLPWNLVPQPAPGALSITVSYDKTSLDVNETVRATLTLHNNTASTENMILATVGVPPGFQVSTADLDKILQTGTLSKYDVTGKQLILYVPKIAPSADVTISYALTATMPIHASDGAAEAHLYYQPDQRAHAAAQTLDVLAH